MLYSYKEQVANLASVLYSDVSCAILEDGFFGDVSILIVKALLFIHNAEGSWFEAYLHVSGTVEIYECRCVHYIFIVFIVLISIDVWVVNIIESFIELQFLGK